MYKYEIDVLNLPLGDQKRTIKADEHKVERDRMNFYKDDRIVASYPVMKINIISIKEINKNA